MKQNLHLDTRQQLQQSLSPLQVQYFRLLELNEAAFEQEVDRQLNDNPALEARDPHDAEADAPDEEFNESADQLLMADYRSPDDIPPSLPGSRHTDLSVLAAETLTPTLFEHLHSQLATGPFPQEDLPVYDTIIGTLDSNGYMTRSSANLLTDIAVINNRPDITPERLRAMLADIRTLDPAGVAAVDLRQCLLLQLNRMDLTQPDIANAREIIADFFDLFSKNNLKRLSQDSGLNQEQLRRAYLIIKSLNPKPGAAFTGSDSDSALTTAAADFIVEVDSAGEITVKIPSNIPELAIEASFAEADSAPTPHEESGRARAARMFVKRQREDAANFIAIVRERQTTLLRIMRAIVDIQRPYFLSNGNPELLRPMILRDVAARAGYDLSVVSRATSSKYVATPWGLIPLRTLFSEQFGQGDTSRRQVMERLRRLIEDEDPANPLTDEQLTAMMTAEGFDVARRTVAKHRRQLGFPIARLRRKL